MTHMATRFSNELHAPKVMQKIVNTYIRPIIEYNSVIWTNARKLYTRKMEDILHRSSRTSLNLPYRTDHPRYQSFDSRIDELQLLTFSERRIIHSIVFIMKTMKEEIHSTLKDEIDELRHRSIRSTRNPVLFDISRSHRNSKSPLLLLLHYMNEFRDHFHLEDSINTTKKKLNTYFLNERKHLIQSQMRR